MHWHVLPKSIMHALFIHIDRPILDAANSLSLAAPRSFLYGSAFTLYCNASGDQLTWLWYHNGRRLGSSNNTLVVPSPTLADAGIYQCFAYGLFSAVSASGNVSAIGNVTIRSEPGSIPCTCTRLHAASCTHLSCSLTCNICWRSCAIKCHCLHRAAFPIYLQSPGSPQSHVPVVQGRGHPIGLHGLQC